MRTDHDLSTVIGEVPEGSDKWSDKWIGSVAAANGSVYGIPHEARKVVKFNPVDESMTRIGPDLGDDDFKWSRGAITKNGIIYCPPCFEDYGVLKIDTNTDNVTELDVNLLPEICDEGRMWLSCDVAPDGCVYFMPGSTRRIMKLDPNNNDAMTSVGDDLGGECKYCGTVVGIDGCVYGIPYNSNRILKYDPINDTTSFVGEELDYVFFCNGDGVLGRDGCIYAVARKGYRVLKIDTTNNQYYLIETVDEGYSPYKSDSWGDAILGVDGCIYWPPNKHADRVLKHDPYSNQTSMVGDDFEGGWKYKKWCGGSLASDGVIYCLPYHTTMILCIDPFREFKSTMKMSVEDHPEQLGCIFQSSNDGIPDKTNFDCAVVKFGYKKVLKVLDECMPPVEQMCAAKNLYPFLIAASCKSSDVSMIFHLSRQVLPSLVDCVKNHVNHDILSGTKRKCIALDNA